VRNKTLEEQKRRLDIFLNEPQRASDPFVVGAKETKERWELMVYAYLAAGLGMASDNLEAAAAYGAAVSVWATGILADVHDMRREIIKRKRKRLHAEALQARTDETLRWIEEANDS
jgi:hypothetical protein